MNRRVDHLRNQRAGRSAHHAFLRRATWPASFISNFAGRDLGCFRLHVPGAHNVLNATAAVAVGLELEIPVETIREGSGAVSRGVDRRFQVRGAERGVTVIDDYGHHPTEIRATLAAARACRFRRVHVLFQPHRYTRTQALMDDFARAFHQADTRARDGYLRGVGGADRGRDARRRWSERIRAFGHRGAHYAGVDGGGHRSGDRSARDRATPS